METEKILNKIFAELTEKAYDGEYHVYNYKITNQIIRANIEALMEAKVIAAQPGVSGSAFVNIYEDDQGRYISNSDYLDYASALTDKDNLSTYKETVEIKRHLR